jgi:hypothetical protein
MSITFDKLVLEIAKASEKAFQKLFENGERYYYCALITTGEAFSPFISAWSWEALQRETDKLTNPEESKYIKWSYADSPYMCFGEEYFKNVDKLFDKLPHIDSFLGDNKPEKWEQQYDFRLKAMEQALKQVDSMGIFSKNQPRKDVYINVEVMPPDETNTKRALRLNQKEDITMWLEEAAE